GGLPLGGLHTVATASLFSGGLIFIVVGAVTLCMWIASVNESAAFSGTILFLWLAFVLTGVALLSATTVIAVIAGICAIVSGLIGAYASFAELYNASTMREVVPVGESEEIRVRSMREEQERIRRLHPAANGMHVTETRA
ncbi:MAG TPA: GPR1/FUN34/YaaH family transporter, partial [Candidatus Binataceae bacterium]|nr:GPR1/FUN34/YaaH family transporter [Candidatus Binataceae bacterium]